MHKILWLILLFLNNNTAFAENYHTLYPIGWHWYPDNTQSIFQCLSMLPCKLIYMENKQMHCKYNKLHFQALTLIARNMTRA